MKTILPMIFAGGLIALLAGTNVAAMNTAAVQEVWKLKQADLSDETVMAYTRTAVGIGRRIIRGAGRLSIMAAGVCTRIMAGSGIPTAFGRPPG